MKQEHGIHRDARKRGAPPSPSQPLRQRIAYVYSSMPRSIPTCPVNSLHKSTVSGLAGLCLGARCRSRCRPSATISTRMTCQHSLILLSWPRIAHHFVIDVLSRILSLVPFVSFPSFVSRRSSLAPHTARSSLLLTLLPPSLVLLFYYYLFSVSVCLGVQEPM